MSDKSEEGWLVALWDFGAFEREDAEFADAALRRLHAENERLNNTLQWEQNRSEHIGTHGPGCHTWGHRHYECLLRQYKALLEALEELCACPQWVDEATVPKAGIEAAPQQVVVNMSVALLKLRKARAAIAKATGGDA